MIPFTLSLSVKLSSLLELPPFVESSELLRVIEMLAHTFAFLLFDFGGFEALDPGVVLSDGRFLLRRDCSSR